MTDLINIYSFALSGNSHRVALFASIAKLNYNIINVNLPTGEHKQPEFLKINPFGQVPAIVVDAKKDEDSVTLSDSNAILVYLAKKYAPQFISIDPLKEAKIQQFLSLVSGELAFGPAAARVINVFKAPLSIEFTHMVSKKCLTKLDSHLENRAFLVGDSITIADIAVYTYAAHAPEGGVDLLPYPNVCRLLNAIENLEGFIPMQKTNVGLLAQTE